MTKTQVGEVINPDGTRELVYPQKGGKFSLEELQKAVGGMIEIVGLKPGNGHATMYCNEEGKLESLAPNRLATRMSRVDGFDVIVGSVIIVRTENLADCEHGVVRTSCTVCNAPTPSEIEAASGD